MSVPPSQRHNRPNFNQERAIESIVSTNVSLDIAKYKIAEIEKKIADLSLRIKEDPSSAPSLHRELFFNQIAFEGRLEEGEKTQKRKWEKVMLFVKAGGDAKALSANLYDKPDERTDFLTRIIQRLVSEQIPTVQPSLHKNPNHR